MEKAEGPWRNVEVVEGSSTGDSMGEAKRKVNIYAKNTPSTINNMHSPTNGGPFNLQGSPNDSPQNSPSPGMNSLLNTTNQEFESDGFGQDTNYVKNCSM